MLSTSGNEPMEEKEVRQSPERGGRGLASDRSLGGSAQPQLEEESERRVDVDVGIWGVLF